MNVEKILLMNDLLKTIYAYLANETTVEGLLDRRNELHDIVDDLCDEFEKAYCKGGLNDV